MKAAYLTAHGGNEIVAVGERPRPERRAAEVLVRLRRQFGKIVIDLGSGA